MSEHLDPSILKQLQEVMGEEYPQLLEAYLLDAQTHLTNLQQAYQLADSQGLWQTAHSFKGSCSNLGAVVLAKLCEELESLGRHQQWQGVEAGLEQLERELAVVRIYFRAECQRHALRLL